MRIKQFQMVPREMAVLASRKEHMRERCYDRKENGFSYAWVLIDGEGAVDDHIELMEIAMDGTWDLCDRCFVVSREHCPVCGQGMHPRYDGSHKPAQWQECHGCGYVLDMEGGEDDGE